VATPAEIRQDHRQAKQALIDQFRAHRPSGGATRTLLRGLTRQTDQTLKRIA